MVAPLIAAAGITAGAGFLGGLFDRSAQRKADRRAEERDDSRFQRATADAKAAGLHPLFALGAAGAGSPSFIAGQSQTGSALGDAVRGVGSVAAAQQRSKIPTTTPIQQRMAELQIQNAEVVLAGNKLDLVEKQRNLSDNQLVTQSAASSQDIEVMEQMHTKTKKDIEPHKPHQKISIIIPGGKRLVIGPSATAEEIEDIFGDLAGSAYGVMKLIESFYETVVEEARTKNWGDTGVKKTLQSLKTFYEKQRSRLKKSRERPATTYPLAGGRIRR